MVEAIALSVRKDNDDVDDGFSSIATATKSGTGVVAI